MTLVTIETTAKSEEINSLVIKSVGRTYLWIGGIATRHPAPNRFLWLKTGNQITSTFWYDNYPQFSSSNNEYCILIGFTANMKWANYNCVLKYGYMCEEDSEKLKEQDLQKNLTLEIKERENLQQELEKQKAIAEDLKEQLENIKEHDLKNCKGQLQMEKKWKRNILGEDDIWLKQQPNLEDQQQNYTKSNEMPKKQEDVANVYEKILQEKIYNLTQSNVEENNKFRNIIFQFQRNTYIQANGRQP